MITFFELVGELRGFMEAGGNVLWLIAFTTLLMWTIAFERIWYFKSKGGLKSDIANVIDQWESRPERKSWNAHSIREMLISETSLNINAFMPLLATLVKLCPLLGLLGTVTGMIEVFNVMAVTGGGDAKSMAGGVSKATIPTMSGMVAAISGLFANSYLTQVADREKALLEDHLTMDH
ncbi:MAG: MotA/TolQ/ExbB proton channel family protein [Pseudomonadota bacterium]